jgi:glutathione synthase/RimK-type ligase-like ATP-grasp enzyme
MSFRVALVTCRDLPDLDADDRPLKAALEARGVEVTLPLWDGPRAAFSPDACDLVVIRNPWDYTTRLTDFLAFVDDVAATNRLENPAAVVHDNTNKLYLRRLADAGVPTVPTAWLVRSAPWDLPTFADVRSMVGRGAGGYVVKPVVGAGSRDTVMLKADDDEAGDAFLRRVLPREDLMAQPFLPRIADGEVSLIFLDGAFSHAVIKKPKAGDFRSQPEFGSVVTAHVPTAREREIADAALAALTASRLLFARVDLVTGLDDAPVVIEVELTEPSLYLGWSAGAADRLADAIVARAARR